MSGSSTAATEDMDKSEYLVQLNISAEAYQRLYRGTVRNVLARDSRGLAVQFPASALRPFVTREGVHGLFLIRVDADNKLLGITRRSP